MNGFEYNRLLGRKLLGTMIFLTDGVCMCLYLWPPVRAVCQNHEFVVLQTWTETNLDLGSVANYTFNSSPPAPPVSTVFLDISIPPFYTIPPPSVLFVIIDPHSCTHSPPPLLDLNPVHLIPLPPAPITILRRSTLRSAPRACVCRRFLRLFDPPSLPRHANRSLSACGDSSVVCPSSPLVITTLPPVFYSEP